MSLRVLTGNAIWRTAAYATEGRWQLYLTIPPAGGCFEGSGSQTEEEDSRAGADATTAFTWSLPDGEATVGAETRWDRSDYENYFTTARRRDSVAALVAGRQLSRGFTSFCQCRTTRYPTCGPSCGAKSVGAEGA